MKKQRTTTPVKDGRITGRNGYFDMEQIRLITANGFTFIDGIGKSGKVLNAGLSLDAEDFAMAAVHHIPDSIMLRELRSRNYALAVWSTEDVIMRGEERDIEVSEDQARNIIGLIDNTQDCTIGITWDTIDIYTDDVLENWED